MSQLEWPVIIHELGLGHPMKFIWEERAKALITYPNFWKQFYRKFPQYREATITAREFEPGERVEVDYAGDPIEWYEIKTGEIHKAYVFVSGLGFSQLLAYFQELLKQARQQSMNPQPTRDIVRRPGNPFLRYVGGAALQATDEPSIPPTAAQENLPL